MPVAGFPEKNFHKIVFQNRSLQGGEQAALPEVPVLETPCSRTVFGNGGTAAQPPA